MEAITETMSQEQPYEKFMRFGAEALTEAELLAVILRTGTRNCTFACQGKGKGIKCTAPYTLKGTAEDPGDW